MNRAAWDLAYEGAELIPNAKIDIGDPRRGSLAPPGEYTVRLTVDGHASARALTVEPDPRSSATAADLAAQLAFALGVRDRMTEIAGLVTTIRGLRGQLTARHEALGTRPQAAELVDLGKALVTRLDALEGELHNPEAEVAYDILAGRHGGAKLYSRLSWLFEGVKEHDGPPTQGMEEVAAELGRELAVHRTALHELVAGDLARLNARAAELAIPYVVVGGK